MRYLVSCFTICIISITVLIWVKIDTRQKELEIEMYIKVSQMQKQIDEQNKEIRLLRQDIEIIQNGWEEK